MASRDYKGAERLLADARKVFPETRAIIALKIKPPVVADPRKEYAGKVARLRGTLVGHKPPLPVNGIKKQLAELKRLDPTAHRALEDKLAAALAGRFKAEVFFGNQWSARISPIKKMRLLIDTAVRLMNLCPNLT